MHQYQQRCLPADTATQLAVQLADCNSVCQSRDLPGPTILLQTAHSHSGLEAVRTQASFWLS